MMNQKAQKWVNTLESVKHAIGFGLEMRVSVPFAALKRQR